MSNPYTKAINRAVLATILVLAWVIWFDGPAWAWAILAIYVVFNFALAHMLNSKLAEIRSRAEDLQRDIEDHKDDA